MGQLNMAQNFLRLTEFDNIWHHCIQEDTIPSRKIWQNLVTDYGTYNDIY
jgi:hypothetical protein